MASIATIAVTQTQMRCIDLSYLKQITKSNPGIITKMMALYLAQTPQLLRMLRKGFNAQDWNTVFEAAHKLIPSFAIMGIDREYEAISKHIQKTALAGHSSPEINGLIGQLENVCNMACCEIETELKAIHAQ